MSLSISNVSALFAENALNNTQNMMNQTMQQLSTGSTINTGADNPAGLVISEQQLNQVAGLQTAISNTSQAESMVQTADGALNTINTLLTQMYSLAVSAANSGANSTSALAADQAQISSALSTINSIAANTTFNSENILNGSTSIGGFTNSANVTFLSAQSSSPTITNQEVNVTAAGTRANVTAGAVQTGNLAQNETLDINGVNIALTTGQNQASVINTINSYTSQTGVTAEVSQATGATELYANAWGAQGTVTVQSNVAAGVAGTTSGFGTTQNTSTGTNIAGTIAGAAATGSGNVLTGTAAGNDGIAVSVAVSSGNNLATDSGNVGNVSTTNNPLTFQVGANYGNTVSVSVGNVASSALATNVSNGSGFTSLADINVTTQQGAEDSINLINSATGQVSNLRAQLGAVQEYSLQQTQNNLQSSLQNEQAANNVVQGTDYAAATASYAQQQVLMQIGTSVLQNSSQTAQLALSLVKNM